MSLQNFNRITNLNYVTEIVLNAKRSAVEARKIRLKAINDVHDKTGLDKNFISNLIDNDPSCSKLHDYQNKIISSVLIARRVDVSNSANQNRHSSASSTPVNNNAANKRTISDTDETFGIKKKKLPTEITLKEITATTMS